MDQDLIQRMWRAAKDAARIFAIKNGLPESEEEDLSSDAFVGIWKYRNSIRDRRNTLIGKGINSIIDAIRSRGYPGEIRKPRSKEELEPLKYCSTDALSEEEGEEWQPPVVEHMPELDYGDYCKHIVKQFPAEYRRVIILRLGIDQGYVIRMFVEVARELGITASRVDQINREIRSWIKDEHLEERVAEDFAR